MTALKECETCTSHCWYPGILFLTSRARCLSKLAGAWMELCPCCGFHFIPMVVTRDCLGDANVRASRCDLTAFSSFTKKLPLQIHKIEDEQDITKTKTDPSIPTLYNPPYLLMRCFHIAFRLNNFIRGERGGNGCKNSRAENWGVTKFGFQPYQ